jgi:peptidoglycan/LPS O-acetylase OafA/YrhL
MVEAKLKDESMAGGRLYRPELDCVRFVAFLSVFIHHALIERPEYLHASRLMEAIADASGFGLCLFFTLSAYLIADLLMRERERNGEIDVRAFYIRRILRIWPLYILGLAVGIVYGLWMHQAVWARFAAFFFLMGNWYYLQYGWLMNPASILWSISVEEQFYLFWPTVARRFSRWAMVGVCLVLIVIANLVLYHYGAAHCVADAVWGNSFVQFEMFAGGILLAIFLKQQMPSLKLWQRAVLLIAAPICWFSAAYFFRAKGIMQVQSGVALMVGYALVVVGCLSVLLGLLGIPAKFFPRWLVHLGRISYGLYVFHEVGLLIGYRLVKPLPWRILADYLSAGHVVAGLGVTILLAALSYRFFESPFLKLKPVRM